MRGQAIILFISALFLAIQAQAQSAECVETYFSGEVTQGVKFVRNLGDGIDFEINPASLKEDMRWSWFGISVAPKGGVFVDQSSDANWILATNNFGSAWVGGPHTDVRAALEYRSRYLLIPLAENDMQSGRAAKRLLEEIGTSESSKEAAEKTLRSLPLAHAEFEIVDYRLGIADPPTAVEWLKFQTKLTVPSSFHLAEDLPSASARCPSIPAKVLEDLRKVRKYEFFVSAATSVRP